MGRIGESIPPLNFKPKKGSEEMKQGRNSKIKKEQMNVLLKVIMFILFVSGASIFAYPFISDAVNNYYDQKNLAKMQVETEQENIEQLQK